MRYTYRVFYSNEKVYSPIHSMLIRAKSESDAERKFKEKFPEYKFITVK